MAQDNIQTLSLEPKASVVDIFNEANNTTLSDADALLKLEAAEKEKAQGLLGVRVSQGPNDQIPYKNTVNVRWKRLDLGLFFPMNLHIPLALPSNTILLLAELRRRTGLKIDDRDVVLENITFDTARTYLLKARPESYRWYGQVEINLLTLADLNKLLPPPLDLGDLGVEADPQGWVLEYGGNLNGNLHTALWNALEVDTVLDGDILKTPLVHALQDVLIQLNLTDRWTDLASVAVNNLHGAKVIHNGDWVDHLPPPFNQTLTKCVRVLLDDFYCTTPTGIFTVYYNPEFTPGKE